MEQWSRELVSWFDNYISTFTGLTEDQKNNFQIKRDHSVRVAERCVYLGQKLGMDEHDLQNAYFIGLFHDLGRFQQLKEYNTFDDSKSVDHAELSAEVVKEKELVNRFLSGNEELVAFAIESHNKMSIPAKKDGSYLKFARLVRDADKLDILKVLTDYYTNSHKEPNHTLTWELPRGTNVSEKILREIMAEKLVPRKYVVSEIDVKVMQMSWVMDLNFKPSVEYFLRAGYMDAIYKTLPKKDEIISVYGKLKTMAGNKML